MLIVSTRRSIAALLALSLAASQVGCATKFVAKVTNPLRPDRTAGWDPGELSPATVSAIEAQRLPVSWKKDPAAAIAALERSASRDVMARRAVIEVSIAAGIEAHAQFLSNRGAAAYYLCAAEHAYDGARQGDAEFARFCREASRYSVARLATLREAMLDKGIAVENVIPGPTRTYHISIRSDVPGTVKLDSFKVVTASDRYKVEGGRELALVEGVGTPLIGKVRGPEGRKAVEKFVMPDGIWIPLTATVEFGPQAATRKVYFTIYDRKNTETVQYAGRRETLAADFATPFAVRTRELNQSNFFTLGILGFLRGDRFFEKSGLYPLEYPRKDKIPVLFVHGLISEPNDWRFLHNDLLADPEIRQNYQFWAFYYPTSMAVPWSATLFRRDLKHEHELMNPGGNNPKLNQMVLIGHSMGGLLSRMQIVEGGESLYRQYFTRPVDRLRISASDRTMMKDMFYFSPNPDVNEVVFVCVPHKGSDLATNWIGKIGRTLARLPVTIITTSANVLTLNADALAADVSVRPGTSIDSLSPGGKFARTLDTLPMSRRVEKYSIIGNRGKAGPLEKSSDGVVPYWSSHIDGVPETIIPSTHSGTEHPQCAIRIKEILHQKLGSQVTPSRR